MPLSNTDTVSDELLVATNGEALLTDLLRCAIEIAGDHHEKWDGNGYPRGLRGEAIPLVGRITAVADVFDALGSVRPYKPAFPLEECFAMMEDGRGTHFDPQVLDAFFARRQEILRVRQENTELSPATPLFELPLTADMVAML